MLNEIVKTLNGIDVNICVLNTQLKSNFCKILYLQITFIDWYLQKGSYRKWRRFR